MIRQALKATWPGCKFAVKCDRYSGGSSLDVNWQDGPPDAAVQAVIGQYHGATFDGMIDLKSYHETTVATPTGLKQVHYGNDYLFLHRECSVALLTQAAGLMTQTYGLPAPEILFEHGHAYINADGACLAGAEGTSSQHYWSARQIIYRLAAVMTGAGVVVAQPAAETRYLQVLEAHGFLAFGDELKLSASGASVRHI